MQWSSLFVSIIWILRLCQANTTQLSVIDKQVSFNLESRNFFDFDGELAAKAVGTWVPFNSLLCTNPVLLSMGTVPCVGATAVSAFGGLALTFKALWKSGRKGNRTLQGRSFMDAASHEAIISSSLSEIVVQDDEVYYVYCDELAAQPGKELRGVFSSTHSLCSGKGTRKTEAYLTSRRRILQRKVWKTVAPALSNYVLETGTERTLLDAAFSYNMKEETGEFRLKTTDYVLEGTETIKEASWVAVSANLSSPMINFGNRITSKTMNEVFWELAFAIGSQAFEHNTTKIKLSSPAFGGLSSKGKANPSLSALVILDSK